MSTSVDKPTGQRLSDPQPEHTRAAARARRGAARQSSRRERLLTVLPFVMALAGAMILGYPVVATLHNNTRQQEIADQYQTEVANAGPDALAAELASAERYNADLSSMPILDPWIESERPDSPAYTDYLAELDINKVMSQIVIPSIHTDLPIYHGTTPSTLDTGVGHLFGTSLPVGGPTTHAVLTGHTGMGTATLFDHLIDLKVGDVFYVNTAGRSLKYEVSDVRVVLPTDTESLGKVPGEDLVTLITCTPYGVNSHRLLVTGTRVALDPVSAMAEQEAATPSPMQPWMLWMISAVVLILVVLAVVLARTAWKRLRRRREVTSVPGQKDSSVTTGAASGQGLLEQGDEAVTLASAQAHDEAVASPGDESQDPETEH